MLGAWARAQVNDCRSFLDIGCGSGVISFILAEHFSKAIGIGVDIHQDSIFQAKINAVENKLDERLTFYCDDVRTLNLKNKIELIISNPPFFEESTLPNDSSLQLAKHTKTLQSKDILGLAQKYLQDEGVLCIVVPIRVKEALIKSAKILSLFPLEIAEVKSFPDKDPFNVLIAFGKQQNRCNLKTISLRERNGHWHKSYTHWVKDLYLKM